MKVYDITDHVELGEIPACPICGNDIDEMSEPAYGSYSSRTGWITLCLIHDSCGERLEE